MVCLSRVGSAVCTNERVAGATLGSLLNTRETVLIETPASAATMAAGGAIGKEIAKSVSASDVAGGIGSAMNLFR